MSAKGVAITAAIAAAALAIAKMPDSIAEGIRDEINSRPLRARVTIAWRVLCAKI